MARKTVIIPEKKEVINNIREKTTLEKQDNKTAILILPRILSIFILKNIIGIY